MIRSSTVFASLAILAAGVAFPLASQAQSTRVPGSIVGGGIASMSGGDNAEVVYERPR